MAQEKAISYLCWVSCCLPQGHTWDQIGPSLGRRFQSKLCTLCFQAEGIIRVELKHQVFLWFCLLLPAVALFPVYFCSGCMLWERSDCCLAPLGRSVLPTSPRGSDLFSMLLPVKTTNLCSSRSPASSPAARPPARASPRGCSTPRTPRSTRTWRPCWRPPPSAGKARRRSGCARGAGPAEVSPGPFLLATLPAARWTLGGPSAGRGPLRSSRGGRGWRGRRRPRQCFHARGSDLGHGEAGEFAWSFNAWIAAKVMPAGVRSTSLRKFTHPWTCLPADTPIFIPVLITKSKWRIHDAVFFLLSTEANRK